ncbi:hypothetical protein [Methanolapillus millepedarum]|uniref:Uncharacterized protein n=1 Tax=Methanolapillus millepedarum TaxID=3028296 RepID=A0AA96ZTL2_9EURY|nr:hypothetical protein MsAc7_02030 [Methanosarcinaceae archaeon Ac7]
MTKYTRKKPVISGTISPAHKRKIDELIQKGEFASISDFLNQAVSEYLREYDEKQLQPISLLSERDRAILGEMIREQIIQFYEKTKKEEI